MKKTILLAVASILGYLQLSAQWVGPTSNLLQTGNYIKIASAPMYGTGGTTVPPLFLVQSLDATPIDLISADHNAINFGKHAYFNNSSIICKRSNNQFAFQATPTGNLTLNTDGFTTNRGFFINSNNNNFFKVTQAEILFKDANQDLFKINSNGNLFARKVTVTVSSAFPDYVFENNYHLTPLKELEAFIKNNKHLPNIPSARAIAENNNQVDLGDLQLKLLEKVEELTLYIIQQQKEIEALKVKLAEKSN